MALHPYAATGGRASAYVTHVSTVGVQPRSYVTQIDPVVVLRSTEATRRPCLSKGAAIAVGVVLALLCLGGVAVALVFTVFWSRLTGGALNTGNSTAGLPAQCGHSLYSPLQPKIVGGVEAKPHSWPWLTMLSVYSKKMTHSVYQCGGALIADQWVITAAHCTSNLDSVRDEDIQIDVHLGVHNQNFIQDSEIIRAESIFTNPRYSGVTNLYDISLLKLASKVTFTDQIQPICLPKAGEFVSPGSNYYVAGWGFTKEDAEDTSPVLMQTQLPVVKDSQCNIYDIFDAASEICAGWPKGQHAPCQGDSGGPLMKQDANGSWVAVALVSYANGCAEQGNPDVLTDVAYFRSWLDQTLLK